MYQNEINKLTSDVYLSKVTPHPMPPIQSNNKSCFYMGVALRRHNRFMSRLKELRAEVPFPAETVNQLVHERMGESRKDLMNTYNAFMRSTKVISSN